MKKYFLLYFSISTLISGCTNSITKTFSPNGLPAYSIECTSQGDDTSDCMRIAGNICQNHGYKVIRESDNRTERRLHGITYNIMVECQ